MAFLSMSQHTQHCLREAFWNNRYHSYHTLVTPKHCTACYHHTLLLTFTLPSEGRSPPILKEGVVVWMAKVLSWWNCFRRIRRCGLVWRAVSERQVLQFPQPWLFRLVLYLVVVSADVLSATVQHHACQPTTMPPMRSWIWLPSGIVSFWINYFLL